MPTIFRRRLRSVALTCGRPLSAGSVAGVYPRQARRKTSFEARHSGSKTREHAVMARTSGWRTVAHLQPRRTVGALAILAQQIGLADDSDDAGGRIDHRQAADVILQH